MGVVLPPTHILSQLVIRSCQCLCSAPYTRNGYQRLDEEGSISQEVLRVSRRSRCQKVGHDLYNKKGHLHFTGTELKSSYLMMGVTSGHSDGHVTLV